MRLPLVLLLSLVATLGLAGGESPQQTAWRRELADSLERLARVEAMLGGSALRAGAPVEPALTARIQATRQGLLDRLAALDVGAAVTAELVEAAIRGCGPLTAGMSRLSALYDSLGRQRECLQRVPETPLTRAYLAEMRTRLHGKAMLVAAGEEAPELSEREAARGMWFALAVQLLHCDHRLEAAYPHLPMAEAPLRDYLAWCASGLLRVEAALAAPPPADRQAAEADARLRHDLEEVQRAWRRRLDAEEPLRALPAAPAAPSGFDRAVRAAYQRHLDLAIERLRFAQAGEPSDADLARIGLLEAQSEEAQALVDLAGELVERERAMGEVAAWLAESAQKLTAETRAGLVERHRQLALRLGTAAERALAARVAGERVPAIEARHECELAQYAAEALGEQADWLAEQAEAAAAWQQRSEEPRLRPLVERHAKALLAATEARERAVERRVRERQIGQRIELLQFKAAVANEQAAGAELAVQAAQEALEAVNQELSEAGDGQREREADAIPLVAPGDNGF